MEMFVGDSIKVAVNSNIFVADSNKIAINSFEFAINSNKLSNNSNKWSKILEMICMLRICLTLTNDEQPG
ncbi:hypothetical protein AB685_22150 [Bacillus sp. LL01]|nr:hypothetical protein AB685_22150 [Bacillus sp. LL01]